MAFKFTLLILQLAVFQLSQCQAMSGELVVRHQTTDLTKKQKEDPTFVQIKNEAQQLDTTLWFNNETPFRLKLTAGNYFVLCRLNNQTLVYDNVLIVQDRITFIELSFESDKNALIQPKRKRKKERNSFI